MTANHLSAIALTISEKNDTNAYKELFVLYHQRLTQFAYSILHNMETSEEVVSDVFLKIWINRKSLSQVHNLHLYLYVATKNLSINKLEKLNREKTFSIDDSIVEFKSICFNPEELMITAEMFQMIKKVICELPPRCQMIFKLIKEDGLSYKDVAELLQLSVKTIENQMTIALRKISGSIHFDIKRTIYIKNK